jgi:hypothetical protein
LGKEVRKNNVDIVCNMSFALGKYSFIHDEKILIETMNLWKKLEAFMDTKIDEEISGDQPHQSETKIKTFGEVWERQS